MDKLIWGIREIIADLYTCYPLQPGDRITGRVEGVAEVNLTIGAAA